MADPNLGVSLDVSSEAVGVGRRSVESRPVIWNAIRPVYVYAGAITPPDGSALQPPATPTPLRTSSADWRWRGLANPQDEYWQQLGVRIAIAGGVYPLLTAALTLAPWLLFIVLGHLGSPTDLAGALVIGAAYSLMAFPCFFGAGFVYTGLISMHLVPAVAVTLRLLDEKPPRDRCGVFTGSLVAFLATSPFWLLLSSNLNAPADWAGLLIGYGLLSLALMMGQLAGLSASIADARRRRRGRLRRTPFRLTIWRMLAAMIPLSLTLSLLSLAELLTLPTALAMLAAGVTAYLASWPVAWFFHWRADRRLRLRRAKRLLTGRST